MKVNKEGWLYLGKRFGVSIRKAISKEIDIYSTPEWEEEIDIYSTPEWEKEK